MADSNNRPDTGGNEMVEDNGPVAEAQTDPAQRLADCFERSSRRWELIIYPMMILFVLFAGVGFFQIYKLTSELRSVAVQVQPQVGAQLVKLSDSMESLTASIRQISGNIQDMHKDIAAMQKDTKVMASKIAHLESIDAQMMQMNQNIGLMTMHTDTMRYNMQGMNHSIARPMNFMNSFMPW